jgi:hypothetical protein
MGLALVLLGMGCGTRPPASEQASAAAGPASESPTAGISPSSSAEALAAARRPATSLPAGTDSGPRRVTWEQLDLGMEPNSVYQPWMMKTSVAELEGQPIKITGFMGGAIFQKENVRNFPLMRERECPFGVGGQAHHVIEVDLPHALRTSFTTEPVTIEGTFSVRPWTGPNGKTWSLYHVEGTTVERGALADVPRSGGHAAAEAD